MGGFTDDYGSDAEGISSSSGSSSSTDDDDDGGVSSGGSSGGSIGDDDDDSGYTDSYSDDEAGRIVNPDRDADDTTSDEAVTGGSDDDGSDDSDDSDGGAASRDDQDAGQGGFTDAYGESAEGIGGDDDGREPSSEPVPEYDGLKTRSVGEALTPEGQGSRTVVLDAAGTDGQAITERGAEITRQLRASAAASVEGADAEDIRIDESGGRVETRLSRSARVRLAGRDGDEQEPSLAPDRSDVPSTDPNDPGYGIRDGVRVSESDAAVGNRRAAVTRYGNQQLQEQRDSDDSAVPESDLPGVSQFQDIAEQSVDEISPGGTIALRDEGLEVRARKERRLGERAERGVESIMRGEAPSGAEAGALLFQQGEIAERILFGAGEQVAEASPTRGRGPNVGGEQLGDVPGNVAAGIVGGAGMAIGGVTRLPASVAYDVETQYQQATGDTERETPTQAEGGSVAVGENIGQSQVEAAEQAPVSTAVLLGLPAVEGVPAAVRGYRATRGTRGSVRLRDITTEEAAKGGQLPEFETRPGEPTSRAVGEVRSRARDQPDAVKEAAGTEEVLYHSTEADLGPELTVGEGGSELPGLFVSPDASPLRLSGTQEASAGTRLRPTRPDLSTQPDRLAGFQGDQIRAMPERASGAGYAVRRGGEVQETGLTRAEANRIAAESGGERVPDPTSSGFEYLTQEAEPGAAYVRPQGSRTTELESVIPPESRFAETGRIAVELPGGERVPLEVFRRGDQPQRAAGRSAREGSRETTAADIDSQYTTASRAGRQGFTDITYASGVGTAGGSATASASRSGSGTTPSTTTTVPTSTGPTQPTTEPSTAPPSEPPTAAPSEPPSEPPAEPPTAPPSGPPSDPPSAPPSGPPSEPPSEPPTAPPSEPPATPPSRPPTEPPTRIRGEGDADDDEREELIPGVRGPNLTDFVDPLTGDVLETSPGDGGFL